MGRRGVKFEERIVSLAPNATSILFAIGARRSLVGVSKWCGDIAPVGRLARVGDCWKLDIREVVALRPSLIIGSVPFRAEVVAELLKLPAAFVALNPRSLSSIFGDVQRLGGLTGRAGAGGKFVGLMKKQFAEVGRGAARGKPRRRGFGGGGPERGM